MSGAPKTAMVLAAGLGTRMRPLTDDCPKPLIEVAGKALIDYTLDRFALAGVEKAVVNVHYRADQLEQHLRARRAPEIAISDERDELLETGGGLKKARPLFGDEPLYCANTDAIMSDEGAEEACAVLAKFWNDDEMDAALLLAPIKNTTGYAGRGDFHLSEEHRLQPADGKPAPYVFTGLQIISPSLIDEGPNGAFSTRLLWDKASARGRLYGVRYDGFWMHVGDAAGLSAAENRLRPET